MQVKCCLRTRTQRANFFVGKASGKQQSIRCAAQLQSPSGSLLLAGINLSQSRTNDWILGSLFMPMLSCMVFREARNMTDGNRFPESVALTRSPLQPETPFAFDHYLQHPFLPCGPVQKVNDFLKIRFCQCPACPAHLTITPTSAQSSLTLQVELLGKIIPQT